MIINEVRLAYGKELKMPVKSNKDLDMELVRLILKEINKISEEWIVKYKKIQNKHGEKNPFEFSIATTQNLTALIIFITPEPVGLCVEMAHACLKLSSKSYDELKREFGIDERHNDYIG